MASRTHETLISSYASGCRFRRTFVDRIKLSDRLKLCDVADVTKVAACGTMFTGRSGRVGKLGGSFLCDAA